MNQSDYKQPPYWEALGSTLAGSNAEPLEASSANLMIRGQAVEIRTLHDLVLLIVRLRCEKGLSDRVCERITQLAQINGLLDAAGKPTPRCFALMDDDAEKLARDLTRRPTKQPSGLCACGCGKQVSGKAKTATQACRKRLSRVTA